MPGRQPPAPPCRWASTKSCQGWKPSLMEPGLGALGGAKNPRAPAQHPVQPHANGQENPGLPGLSAMSPRSGLKTTHVREGNEEVKDQPQDPSALIQAQLRCRELAVRPLHKCP